jgi:hypothetical protein
LESASLQGLSRPAPLSSSRLIRPTQLPILTIAISLIRIL